MRTALLSILIMATFISFSAFASEKDLSGTAFIEYRAGNVVKVSDWLFEYLYAASDTPPPAEGTFSYTRLLSRDLMIDISGTSKEVPRKIAGAEVASITYDWDFGTKTAGRPLRRMVLRLKNGEELILLDENLKQSYFGIRPAKSFFTEKKYFWGGGLCPCISLVGRVREGQGIREFSLMLNSFDQNYFRGGTEETVVTSIRFESSSKPGKPSRK